MENEKRDRLRYARKKAGFDTAAKAAAFHGWTPSTYSAHENGQNDFDERTAIKYALAFKVAPEWLILGTGDQDLPKNHHWPRRLRDKLESSKPATTAARGFIAEIDARIGSLDPTSADANARNDAADQTETVRARWLIPDRVVSEKMHATADNIQIVEMIGDSMEPRLWEGDHVFVDTRQKAPSPEGIFALKDSGGIAVKYVEVIRGSEPLMFRISSANQQYKPYETAANSTQIIGRYVGRLTTH